MNLNLDMANMFGAKKKKKDPLLGELASGGPSVPATETQPMSDDDPPLAAPGAYPADVVTGDIYGDATVPAGTDPVGVSDVGFEIAGEKETAPASVGGTAINTGANAGVSAPLADPMYYTDEHIDPFIKQNVLGRDQVSLDAAQMQAAGVGQGPGVANQTIGDSYTPGLVRMDEIAGPQAAKISPTNLQSQMAQEQQMGLLQQIAGGQMSPVIQQQRERGIQDTLAMMASQRGAPTSAVMRTGMEGMSEVNRQATEAASQQQLQGLQMLGDAAGRVREQDIGLATGQAGLQQEAEMAGYQGGLQQEGEQAQLTQQMVQFQSQQASDRATRQAELDLEAGMTNAQLEQGRQDLIAQFQNQANQNNAQMQNEMTQAETQVNAQLEQQRDSMIASLTGMGVDRDTALMQTNAEIGRLKEELLYKYWAGKLGATTEVTKSILGETAFSEDMWEQIKEEGSVLNLFGEYGTPGGYNVPGMMVSGSDTAGGPSAENAPSNIETWSNSSNPGTDTGGGGMYKDEDGNWVFSGIEAKENVQGIGTRDELLRKRTPAQFGQMQNAGSALMPRTGVTDPMAMQSRMQEPRENKLLGDIKRGLRADSEVAGMKAEIGDIRGQIAQQEADAAANRESYEQFKSGADTVSELAEYGKLGELGVKAIGSKSKEERAAAQEALAKKGTTEAIQGTTAGAAELLDEAAEGITRAAKGAGTLGSGLSLSKEAVAQGAATSVAQAAPYIGGAIQFIGETLGGGEVLPAAVQTAGAVGGGLGGKWAGSGVGAAIGSLFPGAGTAIGSAIGGTVGAAAGAGLGQAATQPIATALSSAQKARGASPMGQLRDMSERVGAPTAAGFGTTGVKDSASMLYSGLETKRYIEGLTPVSSDMGNYVSDENAKMGIGGSEDELSNFLRELNPVKYDYKPEYGGEKNQYGIIAQDAQKSPVGDSFVEQNGDGTHMIDTGKATMVNMAALANQQQILDKQGDLIAMLLGEY